MWTLLTVVSVKTSSFNDQKHQRDKHHKPFHFELLFVREAGRASSGSSPYPGWQRGEIPSWTLGTSGFRLPGYYLDEANQSTT